MRRICIVMVALLLCRSVSSAETVFKPVIPVSHADSLVKFSHSGNYSVSGGKFGNLYEFTPYDPLRIKPYEQEKLPSLYARFGIQMPVAPSASVGFNKSFSEKFAFNVSGSHDSYLSGFPVYGSGEKRMDNTVRTGLKYVWDAGELSFGLKYDYSTCEFDEPELQPASFHSSGNFGIRAGICSTKKDDGDLYYKFNVDFNTLKAGSESCGDDLSLTENAFHITGYAGTNFDVHRVYVDMDMQIASYKGTRDYTAMVVQFSPLYEYKCKRFAGKFGVTFGNRFGNSTVYKQTRMEDGNDISAVSSVFPNVDARVEAVRNYLWAHLAVGGGYEMNSYSSLSGNCILLSPDTRLRMGQCPVDVSLALESVISGRFSANISGRYKLTDNKPLISPVVERADGENASLSRIRAWDVNMSSFVFSTEVMWKSESFLIGGEVKCFANTSSTGETVTELPSFTSKAYLRYNWRHRIVFSADFNYIGPTSGTKWGYYEVPSIRDMNLGITYHLKHNLSIFAKFRNLLNAENQYMPLYAEQGLNIGGGVILTL